MNLVWHRADLRLHDNPALQQALQGGPTLGVVVLDPQILKATTPRRRAWFYRNARALQEGYQKRGGVLLVRTGAPWEVLPRLVEELGVRAVYAVRNTTPYARFRDEKVALALGRPLHLLPGQYIHEPGTLRKPDGGPYTVFTPYAKRWWATPLPNP
ncbi:deoxyribodipyrimidine photo-lyase, partial [Meiothermus luteus]|uniref:deoxyribodipyrimidine photo-lyase n=1 Tax=Meiothermus luteus TaxID=2026184 RepID=UPI0011C3D1E8